VPYSNQPHAYRDPKIPRDPVKGHGIRFAVFRAEEKTRHDSSQFIGAFTSHPVRSGVEALLKESPWASTKASRVGKFSGNPKSPNVEL